MSVDTATEEGDRLLAQLREAIDRSPVRPREIEVGIALSIAIGRQRPAVSCGGCSTPLEFDGIPAQTNAHLSSPFRLIVDGSGGS